jgi:hypothetical protein
MSASPIPRAELHTMLDDLLDVAEANGGHVTPDSLRAFLAGVAQGRGVDDHLHEAGIKALQAVPQSPRNTFNERQSRAYHIGVLRQLLLVLGGIPGQASPLPGNFNHGALCGDLTAMLGGKGATGAGAPQILTSARKGQDQLKKFARSVLVGAVYFEAERSQRSLPDVFGELLHPDFPERTWQGWVRKTAEAQGIRPDEVSIAPRSAARGNGDPSHYILDAGPRAALLELAWDRNPWHPNSG